MVFNNKLKGYFLTKVCQYVIGWEYLISMDFKFPALWYSTIRGAKLSRLIEIQPCHSEVPT